MRTPLRYTYMNLLGRADDDHHRPRGRNLRMPHVLAGLELRREWRDRLALGKPFGAGQWCSEQ